MKHRTPSLRPTKICQQCGLPFQWRKKWERDWDQVLYCSERCRRQKQSRSKLLNDPRNDQQ
ncbi:MAG: DUF2256 domain-containing protein [Chitinophagaceae bacterium]